MTTRNKLAERVRDEPVVGYATVVAAIGLAIALGVPIDDELREQILAAYVAVGTLAGALLARRKVTPTRKLRRHR